MTFLAAELQALRRIEQRGDDVGVQVMLEGIAQVTLFAPLGDVSIAGQEHINENRGEHREHDPDYQALVKQPLLSVHVVTAQQDRAQRGRRD